MGIKDLVSQNVQNKQFYVKVLVFQVKVLVIQSIFLTPVQAKVWAYQNDKELKGKNCIEDVVKNTHQVWNLVRVLFAVLYDFSLSTNIYSYSCNRSCVFYCMSSHDKIIYWAIKTFDIMVDLVPYLHFSVPAI